MNIEEFDYLLDKKFIAQQPLEQRDKSKMMVLFKKEDKIVHSFFYKITDFIDEKYVIVLNNTKVFPAKLIGLTEDNKPIDILLVRELKRGTWEVLAKPQKRLKKCKVIKFGDNCHLAKVHHDFDEKQNVKKSILEFEYEGNFFNFLEKYGKAPLPLYIKRKSNDNFDKERYQTIFAKEVGSIAAPTAGFHFTKEVLNHILEKGIKIYFITLHVGIGTFKPIRCKEVEKHNMEAEYFEISPETLQAIIGAREKGEKILAVGTTTTRALESIDLSKPIDKGIKDWTNLFIYPNYNFKIVDALLTNFHLPKSTLLLLVCAFAGKEKIFNAYQEAIKNNYRFYSYGDCMLIL